MRISDALRLAAERIVDRKERYSCTAALNAMPPRTRTRFGEGSLDYPARDYYAKFSPGGGWRISDFEPANLGAADVPPARSVKLRSLMLLLAAEVYDSERPPKKRK